MCTVHVTRTHTNANHIEIENSKTQTQTPTATAREIENFSTRTIEMCVCEHRRTNAHTHIPTIAWRHFYLEWKPYRTVGSISSRYLFRWMLTCAQGCARVCWCACDDNIWPLNIQINSAKSECVHDHRHEFSLTEMYPSIINARRRPTDRRQTTINLTAVLYYTLHWAIHTYVPNDFETIQLRLQRDFFLLLNAIDYIWTFSTWNISFRRASPIFAHSFSTFACTGRLIIKLSKR